MAASAGAAFAVVERRWLAETGGARAASLPLVAVDSTVDALGAIARAHARAWRSLGGARRLVAITGTAGKTTTRVATEAILGSVDPGAVHATAGSLNNRVGAPMVLLGLEPRHRIGILELGTSEPGEIAALASMVEPDVGVLTLVAAAHVEGLGSTRGCRRPRRAPCVARARPAGAGALRRRSSRRRDGRGCARRSPAHLRLRPSADMRMVGARSRAAHARRRFVPGRRDRADAGHGRIVLSSPLLGEAGVACAAAVSVGGSALGLRSTRPPPPTRSRRRRGCEAGRLVPRVAGRDVARRRLVQRQPCVGRARSIRAAAIARAAHRRLVLVLGEMRELGVEHRARPRRGGRCAPPTAAPP